MPTQTPSAQHSLLQLIEAQKEVGASRQQIEAHGSFPQELITSWIRAGLVYRVGVCEARFVHLAHLSPWVVEGAKGRFVARCWKRPDGSLNAQVLFKLMAAVMGRVRSLPGLSLSQLARHFSMLMSGVEVVEVVELLEAGACLARSKVERKRPSLFGEERGGRESVHLEACVEGFINLCCIKTHLAIGEESD